MQILRDFQHRQEVLKQEKTVTHIIKNKKQYKHFNTWNGVDTQGLMVATGSHRNILILHSLSVEY